MPKRHCRACGYEYLAEPGQNYCSAACSGAVAMASVLAGLHQFARAQTTHATRRSA